MSNTIEIKQHVDRLTQLSSNIGEQFKRLKGPEAEEIKKKAKKEGARMGIGAGLSFFGLVVAAVASVYIMAVIILLVDIALDKLWLSALIVVGGFLLIGGGIVAIGIGMASSSAKELSKTTEEITKQIKQTIDEMKTEVEELQKLAKSETQEMISTVKSAAPVTAPVVIGAYFGYRLLKRARKSRKEKQAILKVVTLVDMARAQGKT